MLDLLAEAVARTLRPLTLAAQSEGGIRNLLSQLGWTLPIVPPSLLTLREQLIQLHSSLANLTFARSGAAADGGNSSDADTALGRVAADLALVLAEVQALPDHLRAELPASFIAATHIDEELEGRLLNWLLATDLAQSSAIFYGLLRLGGIIEVTEEVADPAHYQPAFKNQTIHWDRLLRVIDPASLAREVYGWGTPTLDMARLFDALVPLSFALGMPAQARYASAAFTQRTAPGAGLPSEPNQQLCIPVWQAADVTFLVNATALIKTSADELQGLVLTLVPSAGTKLQIPISDGVNLTLDATEQIGTGAALVLRPGLAPSVHMNVEGATASELSEGTLGAKITWTAADAAPTPSGIASSDGTSITARSVSLGLGAEAGAGSVSIFAELTVDQGKLVVAPGDSDGLLASVLPAEGLTAPFSFSLRWSRDGLHFQGSAGLAVTIPLNVGVGPLYIQSLEFAVGADEAKITGEAALTSTAAIGPVKLTVERVGLAAIAQLVHGNLGNLDLQFGFKPPSGVGLGVDTGGVSGGGFLGREKAKHEYSGVLQLQYANLALQAFGLITTEVAGGQGYSLLALIDANFPPEQLGWGFTLNGVGGLLAVHRTASVDALRAGLKAGALSNVLFPKNAITNAPQILAALDTFFPTAPGRFLFGPMALIGWGTPTLLTAALAIIVELPEPVRIILLGRLAARIPSDSDTLIRINMDSLGVLDLSQGTLALDATLFDSRLLSFTLAGDMALRASWTGQGHFLISVGGYHPRFTPPSGFPSLKRMSLDMASGAISTLHLESYLAITSNTLQMGANLHVKIGVSAFSIDGHLGFDALFHRHPFHLDADISGSVAVSIEGEDFLSVSLDATLTGPAPWNLSGNFKVHIVFFDVHKSFSETWGDDAAAELIDAVDVGALLATEFADVRSWSAQLPDGVPALVTTRDLQNTAVVVAHPLAQLGVHERTVPLGLDITRFGPAPVSGANHFAISDFHIGATALTYESVEDDFAPAQFFDLTDDQKLEQPSFERHDAGVRMNGGRVTGGALQRLVTSGSSVNKTIKYETFFVDQSGGEPRTDDPKAPKHTWSVDELQGLLNSGSAGRATMMRAGNRRYATPGNPIHVAEPAFVVVDTAKLAPVGLGPVSGSVYSDARALLNKQLNQFPGQQGHLQIVATHEMLAA